MGAPKHTPRQAFSPAIAAIIADLRAVEKNAMFRGGGMDSGYATARALGLLEQVEVSKPCGSCGHPKHDYTYSRLTLAGKAYLSLVEEISQPRGDSL